MPVFLIAVSCSVFFMAIFIFYGQKYAEDLERKHIHAMAPLYPDIVINAAAFQKIALDTPDLLPVYGASEEHKEIGPYQANQFFQNYPTGFAPFDDSKGGAQSLTEIQALASLGDSLKGKKIIISFTPKQFYWPTLDDKTYAGFFTNLHAYELIFNPTLSYSTKQSVAKRMQDYSKTLKGDKFLSFAINELTSDSMASKIMYWTMYPLGRLQADIMELQDHYQSVLYISKNQKSLNTDIRREARNIDWQNELANARDIAIKRGSSNPFGFSENYWRRKGHLDQQESVGSEDAKFLEKIRNSKESSDFVLLLQVLKELGAKPLLVGRPMNDKYFNYVGISNEAMDRYFGFVEKEAARFGFPLVDFKDYRGDSYFGVDPAPHTSQEGWVYVDKIYNDFYHGNTK